MSIDFSRVRIVGPLSPFASGFAELMLQQGYRPSSRPPDRVRPGGLLAIGPGQADGRPQ